MSSPYPGVQTPTRRLTSMGAPAGAAAPQPAGALARPQTSPAPATTPAPKPPTQSRRDTPRVLRLIRTAAVAALFASLILNGIGLLWAHYNISESEAATAQGQSLRQIEATLARADATAADAFLAPASAAAEMTSFYEALDQVSRQLVQAAAANPAQATALADISTQVTNYRQSVAVAWDAALAGTPTAPTQLLQASTQMRNGPLATLESLLGQSDTSATNHLSNPFGIIATVIGWLAIGVLVVCSYLIARRTHRYVNAGLFIAVVLQLICVLVAGSVNVSTTTTIDTVKQTSVPQARAALDAQKHGYLAKAVESQIALGLTDSSLQSRYTASANAVTSALQAIGGPAAGAQGAWQAYASAHSSATTAARIRGNNGTKTLMQAFATQVNTLATQSQNTTSTSLASAKAPLYPVAALAIACGVLAIAASAIGVGQRLREYR